MGDIEKLVKAAKQQGFEVSRTKGNRHWQFFKDGKFVADLAGTPSSSRSLRNVIAALRRAGFQWPPKR